MTYQNYENIFDEANLLWFFEGYIARAIELYQQAFRISGDDPVVAFQLASALLAVGQIDDARRYLTIAERQRQLFGEKGQSQLDILKREFDIRTPAATSEARSGRELDIERLEQQAPATRDWNWYGVALTAESLGLYGVALRAYELYSPGFVNTDVMREEENVRFRVERQMRLLKEMRKEVHHRKAN